MFKDKNNIILTIKITIQHKPYYSNQNRIYPLTTGIKNQLLLVKSRYKRFWLSGTNKKK